MLMAVSLLLALWICIVIAGLYAHPTLDDNLDEKSSYIAPYIRSNDGCLESYREISGHYVWNQDTT